MDTVSRRDVIKLGAAVAAARGPLPGASTRPASR